jgi:hypothetical protein
MSIFILIERIRIGSFVMRWPLCGVGKIQLLTLKQSGSNGSIPDMGQDNGSPKDTNDELVFDGFVRFRLKDFINELEECRRTRSG